MSNILTWFFFHRSLHYCHVSQVPSRTLCVLILPETTKQRHIQRAERQTLLSCLLRQAFRLSCPCQHPKQGSFYGLDSFQCYLPPLIDQILDRTQNISFEPWINSYLLLNFRNKKKLEKQLRRVVKRFCSKYNIDRHKILQSLRYLFLSSINFSLSYFPYSLFHLQYYSFFCPNYSLISCLYYSLSYCVICKCYHVHKKNSSPSNHNHPYSVFPSLRHLFPHSFILLDPYIQRLLYLIFYTNFVISYHKLSIMLECTNYEETFQCIKGILTAPQCLQLQPLLEVQFLFLRYILHSLKVTIFFHVILLIMGALKIASSVYCCLS